MKSSQVEGVSLPSKTTLQAWQEAQGVCFDVDSTVCQDESIDVLAEYLGCGAQVKELTSRAMGGKVNFKQALGDRLTVMNQNPPNFSPGLKELVQSLQQRNKQVYLVSGGFRQIINPIAKILGIPLSSVYANNILFKDDGTYNGFDENEYTCQSQGKLRVTKELKKKYNLKTLAMIGDGFTDLEARQDGGADIFIGYGGVVARDVIKQQANWFIYDLKDLITSLDP